jgi:hypothetical protein
VIDSAQFCGPLGAEAFKAAYALLNGDKPYPIMRWYRYSRLPKKR